MGEEGKASEDKAPATTPSLHGGVAVQSGSGAMAAAASKADLELQLVSGTDHERGLTGAEHKARLEQYGRNALPETKENMLLVFLCTLCGGVWRGTVALRSAACSRHVTTSPAVSLRHVHLPSR